MELFYPLAERDLFPDAGKFSDTPTLIPWRGVLHTTEGKSYAGARSVYLAAKVAPHFTITTEYAVPKVYQHMGIDRVARSLANPRGGVQTNKWRAIQIEITAKADRPDWPMDLILCLRALMIWIEDQTGIQPWSPPFHGNDAYGSGSPWRMAPSSWQQFDGWCGHQHVPENKHWDPGAINGVMALLLMRGDATVPETRIVINHKPTVILVRPQGDGYWIIAYDGGVFAFGHAPANMTQIGGGAIERIISGSVWPGGEGLLLMGEDGGVFALGTAEYMDRVYYPA